MPRRDPDLLLADMLAAIQKIDPAAEMR